MFDFIGDLIYQFLPGWAKITIIALLIGGLILLAVVSRMPDHPARPAAAPISQTK